MTAEIGVERDWLFCYENTAKDQKGQERCICYTAFKGGEKVVVPETYSGFQEARIAKVVLKYFIGWRDF